MLPTLKLKKMINQVVATRPTSAVFYTNPQSKKWNSYYHFSENVMINQKSDSVPIIQVDVCGLKNFIVQNDESVMDVNGPVYPFGSRPEILNFDMNNPPKTTDPPFNWSIAHWIPEEVFQEMELSGLI